MESSANLADTSFLLSCMRCNQLLHDGDRYCPSCGQDQLDTGLDPWASRPAPLYAVGGATEVEHIELPLAGPFTSPLFAAGLAFIDPPAAAAAPAATTRPDQAQGAPPARRPARANVAVRLGLGIGALAITALAAGMAHDLYRTLRAPVPVPVPMPLRAASSAALTATTPAGEPPAISKAALAAAPAPAPIAVLEPVASVPEAMPQRAPDTEPLASVPETQLERPSETAFAPEPGPAAVPAHSPELATTPEAEPDPAPQPDLVPTASAPPQPAEPPATGQASAPPGQCHEALAAMGLCLNR